MMTLAPILPLVLLATPVLVALCVVLVGLVSAITPRREVVPLPRAVARVAPQPVAPQPVAARPVAPQPAAVWPTAVVPANLPEEPRVQVRFQAPPRIHRAPTVRPGLFDDDDVTHIFDRRVHAH